MRKGAVKVLLVEDNPGDAQMVREMLEQSDNGFETTHVERLTDALHRLANEKYDVLLVDLTLPDAHGICTVNHLQAARPELPIVVLADENDENLALQAVQAGAQDYLVKGQGNAYLLSRALWYAIERKERQAKLVFLAQYDQLTELPNRMLFRDRLEGALTRAERSNSAVALMFIDLDRFKFVNDTLGHDHGDQLLKASAARIKSAVRAQDTVARLGGDEFTVILEGISRPEDAAPVAEKVLAQMNMPFKLGQHEVLVTSSIGIAIYPTNARDVEELIRAADNAMYRVKDRGRNGFQFFTAAMNVNVTGRGSMAVSLRHALARNEFEVHYQPQVDLRSGDVIGLEALVRWRHPTLGVVLPARFLNLQEENGQIVHMGQWLLRSVCMQMQEWQGRGMVPLRVAVNLSARELKSAELVDVLTDIFRDTGITADQLELEITEELMREGDSGSVGALFALKKVGVRLAVDDFGSSASSLRCLRRLRVDTLKIDQHLIGALRKNKNTDDVAVVDAIIALGRHLDARVMAEAVETPQQLAMLQTHGCDSAQGYIFSKPLAVDAVTESMETLGRPWAYTHRLQQETALV